MILECLEGMYVTYTSEIFSDPRRKKKVFVEQYLGLFLAELGLFCHFVPGLLAIALSSRLPLFIWIAGIGLGTRLARQQIPLIDSQEAEYLIVEAETLCLAVHKLLSISKEDIRSLTIVKQSVASTIFTVLIYTN